MASVTLLAVVALLGFLESCEGVVDVNWGEWGNWGGCTRDCDSTALGVTPERTRSRECPTGGTTCTPGAVEAETGSCNIGVPCQGTLSQWGLWSECSATCQSGLSESFKTRFRVCSENTLTGNCNNAATSATETCITQRCGVIRCSIANVSYVIVMDSSSSVSTGTPGVANSDEWTQEKNFVKHFADEIGLGTNANVRVGLVNYGATSQAIAGCNSESTRTLANFNALVDSLPRMQGGTAIHAALLTARDLYVGAGCGRENEVRIIFFLTDGHENVLFDDTEAQRIEALVRGEALIYIGAVGNDYKYDELERITQDRNLIREVPTFSDLENVDAAIIVPELLHRVCELEGVWTAWGSWGSCSISCGATGQRTRTRVCQNPLNQTVPIDCVGSATATESCFLGDCKGSLNQWSNWGTCSLTCHANNDASSPPTQMRTRACVGATGSGNCNGATLTEQRNCNIQVPCPGQYDNWSAYGPCSETCQSNVNVEPIQSRERTCQLGFWSGVCGGHNTQVESRTCNVGVPCQGTLTQWGAFGACSATCQIGSSVPTRQRERQCVGNTFTGHCNNASLIQVAECNVEVQCPGVLSNWGEYSPCTESCQSDLNNPPTRTRARRCTFTSFGGNCGGALLVDTATCNVGVGCKGDWSQWSAFGTCMETCQSNVNVPPSQQRTRTCEGGTFGFGCPGSSVDVRNCNVGVSCPGTLTQWGAFGACFTTCQIGNSAPTWQRERECVGNTFTGNCNNASLIQVAECNVEVQCPGVLSNWGKYGSCSESCQSDPNNPPTKTRRRTCTFTSFGGNCGGALLVDTATCNVGLGCKGDWSQWGAFGTCTETCQSNVNVPPSQERTRTCEGGTFGFGCPGSSVDVKNCNVGVSCPGTLTQWGAFGDCSASCQPEKFAPTSKRTRQCVGSTFSGNCSNETLTQVSECNVEVKCPGDLSNWGEYGSCTETCQSDRNNPPIRTRTRTCTNFSFGGNCGGVSLFDTANCNVGVSCKATTTLKTTTTAPSTVITVPNYEKYFELVGQWGQNNIHNYKGQNELELYEYCKRVSYDVIIIKTVHTFSDVKNNKDRFPGMSFARHCVHNFGKQYPTYLKCDKIAQQIKYCQYRGKKIILSIGGEGAASSEFVSVQDAKLFANRLWNLFLGGTHELRTFNSAVPNGINIEITQGERRDYFNEFLQELRKYMDSDSLRKYLITTTVTCSFPHFQLGHVYKQSSHLFDAFYISFVDNCNTANTKAFETSLKSWLSLPGPSIYLGLQSSSLIARNGQYYINRKNTIQLYKKYALKYSRIVGIMLSDVGYDNINRVGGWPYSDYIKYNFKPDLYTTVKPSSTKPCSTCSAGRTIESFLGLTVCMIICQIL